MTGRIEHNGMSQTFFGEFEAQYPIINQVEGGAIKLNHVDLYSADTQTVA